MQSVCPMISQPTWRGPWKVPKGKPVPSAPRVQVSPRRAGGQPEQSERLGGWRCRVCCRPLRPSAPGHRTHSRGGRVRVGGSEMGAWGAGQTPPLKTTKQVQRLRAIVLQGRGLEEKFWWRASRNSVQGLSAASRACKPAQPDPTQRGAPSRVPSHHLQLLLSPTVPPPSLILWAFAPPLPPFPSTNFSLCSLSPSSARDGPAKTDLLDLRPSSPNPPRGKARAKAG